MKSNLKYKGNLYILKGTSRISDRDFFAKIEDPRLLKKFSRLVGEQYYSKLQKNILYQESGCNLLEYKDPCWGRKGNEYICKCVKKDCSKLNICRRGIKLTDGEYKNFAPELHD